jgi:hypothetical protein
MASIEAAAIDLRRASLVELIGSLITISAPHPGLLSMSKPMLARCLNVTQNANAAQLLFRIIYWMPRATIRHHGKTWVANSSDQWCEQTGLTPTQYRRAIARLRQLHLVETEQHLYGGKNVTHVRLTELAEAQLGPGKSAPPGDAMAAQPEPLDSAQLHIQGDSTQKNQHKKITLAFANAHAGENHPDKENLSGMKKGNKGSYPKALKSPCSVSTPIESGGDTPKALAVCWQTMVHEKYDIHVPSASTKELGQFKAFIKACPEGQARPILMECLKSWHGFCVDAKDYGAFNWPSKPTVDFLLKFGTAAINFGLGALKSQSKALPHKDETQLVEAPEDVAPAHEKTQVFAPATSADDTHVEATYEQIVAILEDDEPIYPSASWINNLINSLEAGDTAGDTTDA